MGYTQAPALPYRNLGIVQDGDTASQAIEKDKYVIWKGGNYFAKTDILQGETFVVDTNLTEIPDGAINGIVDGLKASIKTVRKTFVIASYGNCYIGNDFNELEYDGSNFINAFLDFQNNYGYLCIPFITSSEGFCLKVKNTNTFSDAASGNYSGTLVYFEK